MKLVGLVSFYDEPLENIARCFTGLRLAGCSHAVVVDGAYALYPDAQPASPGKQRTALLVAAEQAGLALTVHVPTTPWQGNEVEKRTALFALGWAVSSPGDWLLVIDTDEFVTEAPADLPSLLEQTTTDVVEVQAIDVVAQRINRRDMPAVFPVRKLFRAQPIRVETSHLTYVTADGRYLWGDSSKMLEPTLDLTDRFVVEHHPDRRPPGRQAAKLAYYARRDEERIERRACDWCDAQAVRLVSMDWKFHPTLGCPVGQWHEACGEHAGPAERLARLQLEALGIDPDSVEVENRMGRPPAVPA